MRSDRSLVGQLQCRYYRTPLVPAEIAPWQPRQELCNKMSVNRSPYRLTKAIGDRPIRMAIFHNFSIPANAWPDQMSACTIGNVIFAYAVLISCCDAVRATPNTAYAFRAVNTEGLQKWVSLVVDIIQQIEQTTFFINDVLCHSQNDFPPAISSALTAFRSR